MHAETASLSDNTTLSMRCFLEYSNACLQTALAPNVVAILDILGSSTSAPAPSA
jgi:hypothetical protein